MLEINTDIFISEEEISESFIRSSGPGGQNVNKVATAVQLRFDIKNSPNLPDHLKKRLLNLAKNSITEDMVLIITARSHRTQDMNRKAARERLVDLLKKASVKPRPRKITKPSKKEKEKRLEEKRKVSVKKQIRSKKIENYE